MGVTARAQPPSCAPHESHVSQAWTGGRRAARREGGADGLGAGPPGIDAGCWVECHAECVVRVGYLPVEDTDNTLAVDIILRGCCCCVCVCVCVY